MADRKPNSKKAGPKNQKTESKDEEIEESPVEQTVPTTKARGRPRKKPITETVSNDDGKTVAGSESQSPATKRNVTHVTGRRRLRTYQKTCRGEALLTNTQKVDAVRLLLNQMDEREAEDGIDMDEQSGPAATDLVTQEEVLSQQQVMTGRTDYTFRDDDVPDDEIVGGHDLENGALDLSSTSTKQVMVQQDTSIFDDPTKTHEKWWSEDKTREPTLIDLWREHRQLYDHRHKKFLVRNDRLAIFKKFATILEMPPLIIETRMNSLRNTYQKMFKHLPSGSEPVGHTPRQQEIIRMLSFLKPYIKIRKTMTSYDGHPGGPPGPPNPPPGGPSFKSTPKRNYGVKHVVKALVHRPDEPDSEDDFEVTPIKKPKVVQEEEEEEEEEGEGSYVFNSKAFSRNDRLKDPSGVAASVRRSPRLSPNKEEGVGSKSKGKTVRKDQGQSSSCLDTAPLASTSKPAPKGKQGNKVNFTSEHQQSAALRKQQWEKEVKAKAAEEQAVPPKPTAAARKAAMYTAEQRADERLKQLSQDTESNLSYDVSLENMPWNTKQGSGYRKALEAAKRKKDKEQNEQLAALMAKKNECLENILKETSVNDNAGVLSKVPTPNETWAESLVHKLNRMEPDIVDDFMLHVDSVALRAIRGKWKPQD